MFLKILQHCQQSSGKGGGGGGGGGIPNSWTSNSKTKSHIAECFQVRFGYYQSH